MKSLKEIIGIQKEILEEDEIVIQDILGAVDVGMWKMELVKDEQPRMYGDRTMDKLMGVKEEVSPEEYYKIWYSNIVDRYYEKVAAGVSRILEGDMTEIEYLWVHPDWGEIRVRCGGSKNKEIDDITVINGYHQDVTQIYSLQRKVKSNEEVFASLSNSYNLVLSVDLEEDTYEILKQDNNIEEYFLDGNYSYTKLQKKILDNFIHYDDRENMSEFGSIVNLQKAVDESKPYVEMMARMKVGDGSYIWMRFSYIFVEANEGVTTKVLCVSADINEEFQKMLEAEMKDKIYATSVDITYQTIVKVNLLENMFVVMKRDSRLSDISLYEDNYDCMIEQVVEYIHPEDREEFLNTVSRKSIFRVIENNETECEVQYRRLGIDGIYRWKSISVIYMKQELSEDIIVVIFLKDIDGWKSREEQSKQLLEEALQNANHASNAKTEFLSRMSHDIRTPLNAIIGMTTLGLAHTEDSMKVTECLEKITISSKILLNLINEVLDMNRIESGKIELYEEEFSLSDTIEEVVSVIQPMAQKKNQLFEVIAEEVNHEKIVTDVQRISQIILNLVTNAVKYTSDNGLVKITIKEKKSYVQGYANYSFIVEDNGMGMTEEFLEKIFDPFTRAEDSRVSKTQGTGLGMSIVKNIVDMMNGTIVVDSQVGKGSKFCVELPIKYIENNESEKYRYKNRNVLIIDDEELVCIAACKMLSSIGIKGEYIVNGSEGLEKILSEYKNGKSYYAVIIDWKMPDMSGLEIIQEIRKNIGRDLPVIVTSSYDRAEIEQDMVSLGTNGFINKPLFKSRLVDQFNKIDKNQMMEVIEKEDVFNVSFEGKNILLVEDNEINRDMLYDILGMVQLHVHTAENGREGVDIFNASKPGYYSLILMDVQMPVLNGLDAATEIRNLQREDAQSIPIIAMTANAFAEDIQKSKRAGMNEHIAKPLELEYVIKRLKNYIK